MKKHTISISFEAAYGPSAWMECLHDPANSKRPCWPHDEDGEPFPQDEGERQGCVYLDWFENYGLESLGGPTRTVRFKLGDAEWGDGFVFTLGEFLGCDEAAP